ncbi:MAG: shikimate dehydrogenase [Cyclobacteriaceae bacterium]|jgi:shikimate dehydrogenase|nr:shikimate dehydrogenase [Cytophagales bacterium]HNP78069.1 shikimate dehydrogenase [Cyclobacteriaceae bacterium]
MEKKFGLIGLTVSHSFSKNYFDEKFFQNGLRDYHYDLYPLNSIDDLQKLLSDNPDLVGLNVTIPYKEQVIKYLSEIDSFAKTIGAVNVIKIKDGKLKGYNTDSDAFLESIAKWFPNQQGSNALVLGSGGSSKAVQVALKKLNIPFKVVSRDEKSGDLSYETLETKPTVLKQANLVINTTPLGMSPNTNNMPAIPYDQLGPDHFVYDLIYNPARTKFLQKAEMCGATIKNGLEMLHFQAEKAWSIWNNG